MSENASERVRKSTGRRCNAERYRLTAIVRRGEVTPQTGGERERAGGVTTTSGYSGTPLPRKLGIRAGGRLAVLSAPDGFDRTLGRLPDGVQVRHQARGCVDARRFPTMARALEPDGGLWVAWPKKTSGVATDLVFEVVQHIGLDAGLVDNKVCAIDETWSGLRFVYRVADRPK
jgi:hypothetical protein